MNVLSVLPALVLSPLLIGIINRTKARIGGRQGPPLLQPYYDLRKLLGKGAVFSRTTTWVFRAAPIVALAGTLTAALLVPFGNFGAVLAFPGDLVALAYLFALVRFFLIAASLDTGSPFEGMGASREAFFSALSEPALLLAMAAAGNKLLGTSALISLTNMHGALTGPVWIQSALTLSFVGLALFVVLLAECSRTPVDDPATHLELTMIHEVMILDHSGPDLAFLQYAAALRMWVLGAVIVGVVIPVTHMPIVDTAISLAAMGGLALVIGVVESTMARLRLPRVPQLLMGAGALAVLAIVLEYRYL